MPRLIVIDTQSLFDWMIFRNPLCSDWSSALSGSNWQWIFTSPMRAEFNHVAAKGFGERWPAPAAGVLEATWTLHGHLVPEPGPLGMDARLHCSDPDDQKFIDLAIGTGAHTLVTRDKALLRLARRARERHGVLVRTPAEWLRDRDTPTS